jgi:proteasome inhibitor subunit 1 (PI31)
MVTDAAAMAVVRAARPAFRGAHDGVAFAAHAAFLAAGYSLCAVGPAALTDPPPSGALAPSPRLALSLGAPRVV